MEEQYCINNLMVGHLSSIKNFGSSFLTINHIEGPYIFSKIATEEGKKQKYKEVFTDDIYKLSVGLESQKFDKTYVVKENINIKEYMTNEEIEKGFVTKRRLLNIYDVMKEEIVIKRQKQKRK